MKKHNYILLTFLLVAVFFISNNTVAQEKKNFLQIRFNGFTETITKNFTKEKLTELKKRLERQGLFFSFSNLKYNKKKEIIKISIKIKNKRSNSEVTFNDNEKPIPDIKVGEANGIVIATKSSTLEFIFKDSISN
ncbi:hypothetical protein [Polaribacter uvawellassae]|uniref:hypothetical protein n=1 Tax=Polaribacter uvawellassae TaxID=3133495 RepID=UPI00321A2DB2